MARLLQLALLFSLSSLHRVCLALAAWTAGTACTALDAAAQRLAAAAAFSLHRGTVASGLRAGMQPQQRQNRDVDTETSHQESQAQREGSIELSAREDHQGGVGVRV